MTGWTEAELERARQRMREADRGIGVFTVDQYERAMNQLDDYMVNVAKKKDWKPWGKGSIKKTEDRR